jgi:hypothetical protein
MTWLIVCVVVLVIGLIIRGVQAANRRAEVAGFQSFAGSASSSFPFEPGENIELALVARDMGAMRRLQDDAVKDDYPSSFPLVSCTSFRLVVQMSVTDRTTDLVGSFPPIRTDLRRRIGDQFGSDRQVSSCSWRWEMFSSVLTAGETVGLIWTNERGVGTLALTFLAPTDRSRFISAALNAISAARSRAGLIPIEPAIDAAGPDYLFADARVICSDCGAVINAEDRFCTGCGVLVTRLEGVES